MAGFENNAKDLVSRGDQYPLGLYSEVTVVTDDYEASHGEVVLVDASSNNITVTLPEPKESTIVTAKKIDGSVNTVTISGETVDGSPSETISSQYNSREVISGGEEYYII